MFAYIIKQLLVASGLECREAANLLEIIAVIEHVEQELESSLLVLSNYL